MRQYRIIVKEIYEKEYIIEAENSEEIMNRYQNGEFPADNDIADSDIVIYKDE